MKHKIKTKLIGWIILFVLIIISIIFSSCEQEQIKPELNGKFANDDIELIFDNGALTGKTKCNSLRGEYFTSENYINISIGGTKIYCINEYNIKYLRNTHEYELEKDYLILIGSDYEIILNRVK